MTLWLLLQRCADWLARDTQTPTFRQMRTYLQHPDPEPLPPRVTSEPIVPERADDRQEMACHIDRIQHRIEVNELAMAALRFHRQRPDVVVVVEDRQMDPQTREEKRN